MRGSHRARPARSAELSVVARVPQYDGPLQWPTPAWMQATSAATHATRCDTTGPRMCDGSRRWRHASGSGRGLARVDVLAVACRRCVAHASCRTTRSRLHSCGAWRVDAATCVCVHASAGMGAPLVDRHAAWRSWTTELLGCEHVPGALAACRRVHSAAMADRAALATLDADGACNGAARHRLLTRCYMPLSLPIDERDRQAERGSELVSLLAC